MVGVVAAAAAAAGGSARREATKVFLRHPQLPHSKLLLHAVRRKSRVFRGLGHGPCSAVA